MKNIVVVTPARCGSSWLVTNIAQKLGHNSFPLALSESDIEHKHLTYEQRIQILLTKQPYVTKVFCDGPDIDLHRLQENTEFVWLARKNKLEHFLSMTFAIDTGVFNIHEGETYQQPETLKFKDHHIDAYERVLEGQKKFYQKYKDLFKYELTYEEMFENNPWGFVDDGTKTIKLNHYSDKFIEHARHIAEQLDWI